MRAPLASWRRLQLGVLLLAAPGTVGLRAQIPLPPPAYAVTAWTTREGLAQSAVNTLALDDEGYLWLGTALGLARFDGDTFVTYPRAAAPPRLEPAIALTRGADGRLWFLRAPSGLARILPGGRVEQTPVPVTDDMFHLAVGAADSVWVARVSDVRFLDGGAWRAVEGLPDSIVGDVRALRRDARGALWLSGSRGLVRYEPAAQQATRVALSCGTTWDVAPAADGGAWVATCAGIERVGVDGGRATLVVRGPGDFQRVVADTNDVVWTADRGGVRRYAVRQDASGAWRAQLRFEHPLGTDGAAPNAMIRDGSGGVFIATNGAGLRHVRRLAVRRITMVDGLPERPVHHLAPDGPDGLWIGNCGGLARWRDGHVEVMRADALGLPSPCVHGLLRERSGALWVGQVNELVRADSGGRARRVPLFTGAPGREVSPLLEDRDGRLWFASDRGDLGFLPRAERAPVLVGRGVLAAGRIASLAQDPAGAIWVGQSGRVSRFEDTTLTLQLGERDGMPDGVVRGLLFDRGGALWMVSYGGGLLRWDTARGVQRLPVRGVPLERMLSAIRLDRYDRFWLLGDGGIMSMSRRAADDAIRSGQPVRGAVDVGPADGMPEGNGGYTNIWLDERRDWLWTATVDGVAAVDVSVPTTGTRIPNLSIDDVRIDDRAVGTPDTLRVPARANALEFHYSTPSFGLEGSMRVRYRLRGLDRQWVEAGPLRVARYANVAPGSYVFEVRLDRGPGLSTGVGAAIPVRVAAFWWETATAKGLAALVAGALLWLVVRQRTRGIRERNLALQREITERERAQQQAAEAARELAHVSRIATAGELATSIAHELNQPLAAVMGSAQQARHLVDRGDATAVRRLLDNIEDQTDRAAGVIRSLRQFVLKQHSWESDIALGSVVADTLRLVRQELHDRGVQVDVHDERSAQLDLQGSAVQLQQVLANLLLNAADEVEGLAPERRRITIRLQDEPPGQLRVSVSDAGAGLPDQLLEQVFTPFYTTKPDGLGLGLSLSRSIVEAHGGRLWAERSPEGGSVFHIVLPGLRP